MPAENTASGGVARSVTSNPVFLLTALGLILYGILRLANAIFYERLGVKPEEVGLGYAETLSQSAVGVLVILALGFALFGFVILFLGVVVPASLREMRDQSPRAPTWFESLLLVALLLTVIGGVTAHFVWGAQIYGDVTKAVFGAVGVLGWIHELWAERHARDLKRLARPALATIAIAVASTVALILVGAWDDLRGVRAGQVRHPTFFGLPFGSWGADAARVDWVAGNPPADFAHGRRCLLYLGQANGTAVFYDARDEGRTIRLPAGDVVVTIRNSHNAQQACS
jgi:hypothetical protein